MTGNGGNKVPITKWKKPVRKGYTVYDFNDTKSWKKQNYRDRQKISSCQGLAGPGVGGEGTNR